MSNTEALATQMDETAHTPSSLEEALAEKGEQLADAAEAAFDQAKQALDSAVTQAEATIRKYPLQSLAVGFAVGGLLGLLVRKL